MKRIFNIKHALILLSFFSLFGCKKFLNVEPIDSLSGNNYWQDAKDAETFALEIYRLFREEVGIKRPTILAGDFRHGPILKTSSYPNRMDIPMMASGNVRRAVNEIRIDDGGTQQANTFWVPQVKWNSMDDWTPYFKVIQSANILFDKVPQIAENDPSISPATVTQYQAEAVFMRSVSYFFLIRLYGDVPYYTNSYNQDPLPRTNHRTVAKNVLEDLAEIKDNLPWTYSDPSDWGVRANRGGALILMMHLNMWLAGFDEGNATKYYNEVDRLGDELMLEGVEAEGAYALLPIEQTASIFNGRSKEGLFEIPTNPNYVSNTGSGKEQIESFRRHFVGHVLHAPYFTLNPSNPDKTEVAYDPKYMKKLYPEDVSDGRIDEWFTKDNNPREHMYGGDHEFQYFKFFNFAYGNENTPQSVGFSQIVFRLADAILLQAEALAELGQNEKAIGLLNQIRERANTGLFPNVNSYDDNLKDAIYWERCKELMGEGHYFYDLVRTHKIYNPEYSWQPMTYSAFLQEAWTWPLNRNLGNNNPFMTYNEYWQ